MGKSALALDIALNVARRGKSALLFTLEMGYAELIDRALAASAEVDLRHVKRTEDAAEKERIYRAAFELKRLKLVIHEGADTPAKILAFVRAWRRRHGVDLVVVDYCQLLSTGRRTENRQAEIATISRKLKQLALQEHMPVLLLSQLNREVESRTDRRPRLSDLRESGALEQDADVVMLLYRPDYYRRRDDPNAEVDGTAELHVAKNRSGPTGVVRLVFFEEYAHFVNMTQASESARQLAFME
jgi:replicative DNA helicase